MTRYCIFLLSLFALSSLKVYADNQTIGITLNTENNYRDSSYLREMGEIIIVATPNNNNDKARVSIQVKNTTGDGRGLLLFNSDYTEKETKKLRLWRKLPCPLLQLYLKILSISPESKYKQESKR